MNESTQIFSESCKTNLFGVAKLDKCCDITLQANHLKKKLNCKIIVVFYALSFGVSVLCQEFFSVEKVIVNLRAYF